MKKFAAWAWLLVVSTMGFGAAGVAQEASLDERLEDLEATLLEQLDQPEGADRQAWEDRLEAGMTDAWARVAAGDATGLRPWLACLLARAAWYESEEAAAPMMALGPQMRAYLAQPLAQLALAHGAQPQAVAILAHVADQSEPWQVGVRCASVLTQLQVARGDFAQALAWCTRGGALLEGVAPGLERDLYTCELAGRRFETSLALGRMDQAARALGEERELAAKLIGDAQPYFQEAGRSYRLAAEIHGLDLAIAQQRFQSVARRCEARLAKEEEVAGERTLILMRHSTALAELVREDADRWREPALRAIDALLEGGLGPGPERRASLVRALDVAPQDARAEEWLGELREARPVLSLRERSDLAVLEVARAAAEDLPAAIAELEAVHREWLRAWSQVTPPRGGLGFLEFARRRRVVATLVEAHLVLDPEAGLRAGLEVVLRMQQQGSLTRTLTRDARPTLEQVLSRLVLPGQAVLVYVFGRDRARLIVADDEGLDSAPLAGSPREIEELRRSLSVRSTREGGDDPALRELSRLLLPVSLRKRLSAANQWNVSGLDLLGQLPFARLSDGRGPLGTTTALCMLPSLPLAHALLEGRGGSDVPSRFLLLSSPRVHPSVAADYQLATIPWSRDERSSLLGTQGTALSQGDASFTALSAAKTSAFDVLHLVCHGAPALEDGRGGLWLAPDDQHPQGRVSYEDLAQLRFPPLVILSACGAGRSATRRGEDAYSHLGGAFLKGGATAVLLSPEPVLYETVREFLPLFRRALAEGASPAEALRGARAALEGSALQDALAWKLVGVSRRD